MEEFKTKKGLRRSLRIGEVVSTETGIVAKIIVAGEALAVGYEQYLQGEYLVIVDADGNNILAENTELEDFTNVSLFLIGKLYSHLGIQEEARNKVARRKAADLRAKKAREEKIAQEREIAAGKRKKNRELKLAKSKV